MNHALCVMLVVCLTMGSSRTSGAQAWPGGRGSVADRQRNDYLAYVREGVNEMVQRYERAANAHDAAALSELYAENAALITPMGSVLGRGIVRDRFQRALPRMRAVRLRIDAFAATGELAHVAGRLSYEVVHERGAHAYDLPVSLVLEPHRQSAWRIRTQVGGDLPVTVSAVAATTGPVPHGPSEIAVRVVDASGNPLSDVLVGFEVDEGSAMLSHAVASTNQLGIAATSVTPRSAARIIVRATAAALSGEPVHFTIAPAPLAGSDAGQSGAPAPARAGAP